MVIRRVLNVKTRHNKLCYKRLTNVAVPKELRYESVERNQSLLNGNNDSFRTGISIQLS